MTDGRTDRHKHTQLPQPSQYMCAEGLLTTTVTECKWGYVCHTDTRKQYRDCAMSSELLACSQSVCKLCFMHPIPILSSLLYIPSPLFLFAGIALGAHAQRGFLYLVHLCVCLLPRFLPLRVPRQEKTYTIALF